MLDGVYVFGYGSLLNPESLARSVIGIDVASCVPSRCRGYARTLSVAFPNGGSQADKAYFDPSGDRPPVVLFWDLSSREGRLVNGICIPVDESGYAALESRELRYDPADISDCVTPVNPSHVLTGPVVAFIGKPEFTQRDDVDRGVVPQSYLDGTVAGAAYWDERVPGFLDEFWSGTEAVPEHRVRRLTRIDHPRN